MFNLGLLLVYVYVLCFLVVISCHTIRTVVYNSENSEKSPVACSPLFLSRLHQCTTLCTCIPCNTQDTQDRTPSIILVIPA